VFRCQFDQFRHLKPDTLGPLMAKRQQNGALKLKA
jgi:hypothetical protein